MSKFKEFLIQDVLQWQPQKEIDPLKIPLLSENNSIKYPFYGQATINNGIISFLSLTEKVLNNKEGKPTILIHSNNQNVVYLETPFYLKDGHGATSVLQSENLNEKNALYIITCIKKVISKKFSYNEKATKIALKNTYISLPVDNCGNIDYKYMENYISELEEERISELTAYLQVSGLEYYKLTDEEQKSVEKFNNKEVKTKSFKLGEGNDRLFDITTTKKKFNANCIKFGGKYPYVARSSINNGIRGYITEDEQYLNEAKTISFGQDTATMFYQEKPYFTGDKIKIMTYREKELDKNLACYLITLMKKAFQNFSWGLSSFNETILKNIKIEMPVSSNGSIDYNFIETFINAQQKLAIKNIVDWRDKEIQTTKQIINF